MANLIKFLIVSAIVIPAVKFFANYLGTMLICVVLTSLAYFAWSRYYDKQIIRDTAIKHVGIASIIVILLVVAAIEQVNPTTQINKTQVVAQSQIQPPVSKKPDSIVGKTLYIDDEGFVADSVENLSLALGYIQSKDITSLTVLHNQGKVYYFKEKTPLRIATQTPAKNVVGVVVTSGPYDLKTGYTFTEWLKI